MITNVLTSLISGLRNCLPASRTTPEPLTVTMLIDIGANLTHDSFEHDFDDVLMRARDADVMQMVITGASRSGSHQAAAIAQQNEHLYATAGIHPHHAEETTTEALSELEELCDQKN